MHINVSIDVYVHICMYTYIHTHIKEPYYLESILGPLIFGKLSYMAEIRSVWGGVVCSLFSCEALLRASIRGAHQAKTLHVYSQCSLAGIGIFDSGEEIDELIALRHAASGPGSVARKVYRISAGRPDTVNALVVML